MGSRGRSIKLRIYFLVAIPLIAMVGLLAYVASTTVNNAVNLDRAPDLLNATSLPTAEFIKVLQDERADAVVYLFQPTAQHQAAYATAVKASQAFQPKFLAAMNSPGTKNSEDAAEAQAIKAIIGGLSQLPGLRGGVTGQALTPLQALGGYNAVIMNEPRLFLAEANSLTNAVAAGQALGLIAIVSTREALSQEYALLSGMLAGQRSTQADRAAFSQMVATRQGDIVDAEAVLNQANLAIFLKQVNNDEQTQLAGIETVVTAGTSVSKLPVTLASWQGLTGNLLNEYFIGGVNVASAELAYDHTISRSAWTRVAFTGGIGLVGLLLTITVTILVGRGIIRRLGGLERNALQLAEVQLPDVVGRLRRGESVDVNAEAPALRVGQDEIGRVGQAFDLVRQTAVRAAVDEARLRQGLNDVFRSLARRSQSLLHRQLTLLDQMERRASDPEALDDLFRLDHLTTRMRRHAEGLVILAGAPAGRGWSSPVRMVDVMRGAIAEVEDYARVSVATRSQAALTGSAVADIIHLLAELIENATTLSPPYTSVRVSGDTVANGFAIEVEDRGLGMNPARLAELNDRLANPPEFNPSDSEQLGLFVVSQLAKRHGVRVTLKASPYGGTAAIVLIPRHLVVTEEAFRSGLPGEAPMAQLTANGHHAPAEPDGHTIPGPGLAEINGGLSGNGTSGLTPGVRISGPLRRSQGNTPERPLERTERGAHAAPPPALAPADGINGTGTNGAGTNDLPRRRHDQSAAPAGAGGPGPNGTAPSNTVPGHTVPGSMRPGDAVPFGIGTAGGPPSPFDVFEPRHPAQPGVSPYPDPGTAPVPGAAPFAGAGPVPAAPAGPTTLPGAPAGPGTPVTPFPGSGAAYQGGEQAPYPDQPAPFPGWTVRNPPAAPGGRGTPGPVGTQGSQGPATPMTPVASARPAQAAPGPPWEISRETGPLPAVPGGPGSDPAGHDGNSDVKGLPRRVRQASLAPQLRDSPPARRTTVASTGLTGGSQGPSPAEIRQTMSALQRGWREGRSQMADEPPGPPGPPGRPAGPETPPRAGGDEPTASEETRGD
jgi:signal transduction histidine kinase